MKNNLLLKQYLVYLSKGEREKKWDYRAESTFYMAKLFEVSVYYFSLSYRMFGKFVLIKWVQSDMMSSKNLTNKIMTDKRKLIKTDFCYKF